jgi:putative DNA primase/helicase
MYSRWRFITITGNPLPGTPRVIADRAEVIAKLHREIFPPPSKLEPPPRPTGPIIADDEKLIQRIRLSRHGLKFARLFLKGDISGFPSPSEADFWMVGRLAFWSGGDAERIDRIFRRSALMRPKWDTGPPSYGQRTIRAACAPRPAKETP